MCLIVVLVAVPPSHAQNASDSQTAGRTEGLHLMRELRVRGRRRGAVIS